MGKLGCIFSGLALMVFGSVSAQEFGETNAIEVNYFTGNVLPHSPDLYHLISGHPTGVMLSFSKQTHGNQEWERAYNFPDYGLFFLYQDFKNQYLGECYAMGLHYNFYFLQRSLQFKISEGLAMATNPHDNETNFKNGAFGSQFLANSNFALSYRKQDLIDKFGIQAGFIFTHFSNGRIKSPNSGINTYDIYLGVNYNFDDRHQEYKTDTVARPKFTEPIKYNFVLRSGVNESPIIGSGQKPFYHIGFYADKRISRKSALQLGTELFLTESFKGFIDYTSEAYPEQHVSANTDYKRIGVFIGHELFINKLSLEVQLGYYVYQPFKYDIPVYDRVGAKYYIWDKKIFTGLAVKTHGFLAEAMEFSIGARL
ncbi:MAG TPA: acyloxyacyl hydrolase [Flavobacterium sp.]|nr:acyloxyacyl hydrolase [Flavobacterium sp.]